MKRIIIRIFFVVLFIICISNAKNGEAIAEQFVQLDTDIFNQIKNDEGVVLVDARQNDYYNGWQDPITKTHGHFKNATDFSARWLKKLSDAKAKNKKYIEKRLFADIKNKQIDQADKIIVYSSSLEEARSVAAYFVSQKLDAAKIVLYVMDSTHDRSAFNTVRNYQKLVSPKFVHDLITTNKAEHYTNNHYQLFEVSWGDTSGSYDKGHIDKSVHINTDEFEYPPLWSLDDDQDLIEFAKLYGINKDATIVLYGEDPMASFRAAIILEYMGAEDVRVLNGGLNAYVAAGYPLSKTHYEANKASYRAFDFSGKKLIDTYEDMMAKISPKWQLIDARTKAEHEGTISGYGDLKYKGTIPASIFHGGVFASTSGGVDDYINVDNTMRNIKEITKMFSTAGIDVNEHMSFYCGTGWRVAQILFYLQINGYEDTSIYSNGWYEYSDRHLKK